MVNGYGLFLRRMVRRWSARELCDRLGDEGVQASPSTVYDWEAERTVPRAEALDALCVVLGVSKKALARRPSVRELIGAPPDV